MRATNGKADSLESRLSRAKMLLELHETRQRLRVHASRQKRRKQLLENSEYWEIVGGAYAGVIDRLSGPDRDVIYAISTANDRRYGANWPFWRTWQEHARIRAASRFIYTVSPLAFGAVSAFRSYVIGEGMQSKAVAKRKDAPAALVEAAQDVLDAFDHRNGFRSMQREFFEWSRADGEASLRWFPQDDGEMLVRPVLPEWIVEPPGYTYDEASFGIFTDPDDLLDRRGMWLAFDNNPAGGQYVSFGEAIHLKINVPSIVKRGLPDFAFDTQSLYRTVSKLMTGLGEGAAIQANIALIRQHKNASASAVEDFLASNEDYTQQRPFTGTNESTRRFESGTIIDIDAGQEYVAPPFASNVAGHVEVVQALLRGVAVRWNAPEWIVSADASNGSYSSSLTAESPFVKRCKAEQNEYGEAFKRVYLAALQHYCNRRGGLRVGGKKYPWEVVKEYVDVSVVPPTVETRNRVEESQLNRTYIELGVKSRQTVAMEIGLDYEVEERNNEEFERKHGEQGIKVDQRTPEDGDAGAEAEAAGAEAGGEQPQQQSDDAQPPADDFGDLDELLASIGVGGGDGGKPGLQEAELSEEVKVSIDKRGRKFAYDTEKRKRVPLPDEHKAAKPAAKAKQDGSEGNPAAARPDAAKKKPRQTPDEAARGVRGEIDAGHYQSAEALLSKLLTLTVPQITALKKSLAIRASGKKVELARKVAERALRADPEHAKAHGTLKSILGDAKVDLGDPEAVKAALRKALSKDGNHERPGGTDGGGSGRVADAPPSDGGRLAAETPEPGSAKADQGRDAGGQPDDSRAAGDVRGKGQERVAASLPDVNRRLDRFDRFFRSKGQHHVADWLGKLRDHVNAVGGEAALASLGADQPAPSGGKSAVQYWGVGTDEANWKNMGHFIEAYLGRNGIVAVTGDTSDPNMPLVSALGKPDKYVAGQDFEPADMHYKNKLDEAKDLPGLEKSEDVGVIMGRPVTHLDNEVVAKLNERYGDGRWIVKCYDDNAAAGYGIFFPQRAAKIAEDARNTIWSAGEHLGKYGFRLARNPDTGKVFGVVHESGDAYQFGTEEYEKTIDGDARHWAERAAVAADNEKGAMLPEGSFMAQPAFEAVGISDAERAAGKTWHEKNEGRVHLVTRPDGSVDVVPHATWLKGGNLPVVFEDDDTRAMAKAAKEAIEAIPHAARKGQVYAPDVMKTKDGYRVVELNAQGDHNGSGYLHDNHFTIDAYVSHLTGRQPAHVAFIRDILTTKKRGS